MSNDVVVLYEQNPSFDLIETGPGPGPPGATGLPGLVWRGAWSGATAYIAGDAVSLSGSSYICILGHTNHTPPNATYWNVLAAVGVNGTNGVPGLTWTGAWSSGTAYAVGDAVSLAGSSYIAILGHTNHTPPNATYWNVLAAIGATGSTGPVGATWTGAWSSGTAYVANDEVSLAGSSYICILGHTNHTPPNATYWNVLAALGATGPAGVVWRGAWSSGTAYVAGDGVDLNGSSYLCILGHTNHTPPNATYWDVLAAKGTDGASSIGSGTEAGRPAAGTAGNLYYPTDGVTIERDTGAAWESWGPIWALTTPPAVSGWTWVNQGGATATDVPSGVLLAAPSGGSENARALVITAPSTPYTVTARMIINPGVGDYNIHGLCWRDSGSGKMVTVGFINNGGGPYLSVRNMTSATALSSDLIATAWAWGHQYWMRITDNGTNRIFSISADGQNFNVIHTVGRTSFMTADQIGWSLSSFNANSASLLLISWKVT